MNLEAHGAGVGLNIKKTYHKLIVTQLYKDIHAAY